MLVLSWNLFHGRSQPPTRRALLEQFAAKLGAWRWDVALLQEVPPWWPQRLAREVGNADFASVRTSRNSLLALRRAVAERDPELSKSNGGGSNAILSRAPIVEHAALRLRVRPERRVAQLARLGDGTCVANFHASTSAALAEDELQRLCERALRWAGEAPLILGGDLNLRSPRVPETALTRVASRDVDHLFVRGMAPLGESELLDRTVTVDWQTVQLSDHAPLSVDVGEPTGLRQSAPRVH